MTDDSLPPAAIDAEEYLLASCIALGCADEVFHHLRPADFQNELNRATANLVFLQHATNGGVDTSALIGDLKTQGYDDALSFIARVATNVGNGREIESRAKQVLEACGKRRWNIFGRDIVTATNNGESVADIARFAAAELDDLQRGTQITKPQFPLITAAELATTAFVLNYIAERLLVEKQSCVLGGPKKSLKTTLAVLLAIYLAIGRDVFDKFRVQRKYRVLVASAESGMATIKETALRICDSLDIGLEGIEGLAFTSNVPRPNDRSSLSEFRKTVIESECEILIFDPFYRMHDGEGQESIFKMGAVLGKVADMCDELGLTHVVCHHLKTSRINPYEPAELDDLAYAGFAEHFRQWLLLARREPYQLGSGYHPLWLTIGGSAGHNSLWALDIHEGQADAPGGRTWRHELRRADDVRQEAGARQAKAKADTKQQQLNEDRHAVFKVLRKHPEGLSKSAIGSHAGIPTRRWPSTFAAMFEAGELVPTEIKVSNHKNPGTGYKLGGSVDD